MNASHDVTALETYIQLPARPQQVEWQITPLSNPGIPGPNASYLSAILTFEQSDLDQLIATAQPLGRDLYMDDRWIMTWFPPDLQQHLAPPSDQGYRQLNLTGYAPGPFLKPTSAFQDGFFTRIDGTSSVLVSLNSRD